MLSSIGLAARSTPRTSLRVSHGIAKDKQATGFADLIQDSNFNIGWVPQKCA
jgi:hypothetical protein